MSAISSPNTGPRAHVKGVHGVRYQVKDVARAVAFYTQRLGFKLEHQQLPAFANVSLGDAQILLSGPGASGSRPMPDGHSQEPGETELRLSTARDGRTLARPSEIADLGPDERLKRQGTA